MAWKTLPALTLLGCLIVCATRTDHASATNANPGGIEISPNPLTLIPGATRTMFVRIPDASNVIRWSASGGNISGTGPMITYTAPLDPGNYTITATHTTDATQIARATIEVVPQVVSLSNIPAHLTLFTGEIHSITALVLGSVDTSVRWAATGGDLAGAGNSRYFSATKPGRYRVTSTSIADTKQSSTTTIDVVAAPTPPRHQTAPVACTPAAHGRTFDIGQPSSPYQNISDVNWNALKAGDTVRIFARPTPYPEQIVISSQGTPTDPIRVCGVADSEGNLPVITGENAKARSDLDFNGQQPLGIITVYRHVWSFAPDYPRYIEIEGLALRGAWSGYSFIDQKTHAGKPYDKAAACIRVQNGSDIVIRGNDISDCGNGIFTHAQVPESSTVRNVLISGNYLHDNGVPRDDREHSAYLQAFGLVVEGNYFGPLRASSSGANIKTRSVANIIRCNYVEGGTRLLDIVEVQDAVPYALVRDFDRYQVANGSGQWPKLDTKSRAFVAATEEAYHRDFVYGNIFKNLTSNGAANLFHYADDNMAGSMRPGTLYFYSNTILALMDQKKYWRYGVFDLGYYADIPEYSSVSAFNNLFELGPETPNATMSTFRWNRYMPDRIALGVNFVSSNWTAGERGFATTSVPATDTYPGGNAHLHVTGHGSLISSPSSVIDRSTFAPPPNSIVLGHAAALPQSVSDYPPDCEYIPDQRVLRIRRPVTGRPSLGAREP